MSDEKVIKDNQNVYISIIKKLWQDNITIIWKYKQMKKASPIKEFENGIDYKPYYSKSSVLGRIVRIVASNDLFAIRNYPDYKPGSSKDKQQQEKKIFEFIESQLIFKNLLSILIFSIALRQKYGDSNSFVVSEDKDFYSKVVKPFINSEFLSLTTPREEIVNSMQTIMVEIESIEAKNDSKRSDLVKKLLTIILSEFPIPKAPPKSPRIRGSHSSESTELDQIGVMEGYGENKRPAELREPLRERTPSEEIKFRNEESIRIFGVPLAGSAQELRSAGAFTPTPIEEVKISPVPDFINRTAEEKSPSFMNLERDEIVRTMQANDIDNSYVNFIFNAISGNIRDLPAAIIQAFNNPTAIGGLISVLNFMSSYKNNRYSNRLAPLNDLSKVVAAQLAVSPIAREEERAHLSQETAFERARATNDEALREEGQPSSGNTSQLDLKHGNATDQGAPQRPELDVPAAQQIEGQRMTYMQKLRDDAYKIIAGAMAFVGAGYGSYALYNKLTEEPTNPSSTNPSSVVMRPADVSNLDVTRQPQPNNLAGKTIVPSVYILDPKEQQQQNNLWNAFNFVPRYTEGDGFTPSENQLKAYHMLSEKLRYDNSGIDLESEWGQPKNNYSYSDIGFKNIYDLGYQRPINQKLLPKMNMNIVQTEVVNGEINPMYKNPQIGQNLLEHGKRINVDMALNLAYNPMSNIYATDANDKSIDNSLLFGLVP